MKKRRCRQPVVENITPPEYLLQKNGKEIVVAFGKRFRLTPPHFFPLFFLCSLLYFIVQIFFQQQNNVDILGISFISLVAFGLFVLTLRLWFPCDVLRLNKTGLTMTNYAGFIPYWRKRIPIDILFQFRYKYHGKYFDHQFYDGFRLVAETPDEQSYFFGSGGMMGEHDLITLTGELNTFLKELRPDVIADSTPRKLPYKSYLNAVEFRVEIPFLYKYRVSALPIAFFTIALTVAVIYLYAGLVTTTPQNAEELAGYFGIVGFAIAFTPLWFALFFFTLNVLFGKERLRITPNGAYYETFIFLRIKYREIGLETLQKVTLYKSRLHAQTENNNEAGIEIRTGGKALSLFHGLNTKHAAYLRQEICHAIKSFSKEIMEPKEAAEKLPGEMTWQMTEQDDDSAIFSQQGRIVWQELLVSIFLLCFFSAFLITPFSVAVMFMLKGASAIFCSLAILFSFSLVGLLGYGVFVQFLIMLSEPFRQTLWSISNQELTIRKTYFGIGASRYIKRSRIHRIQILHGKEQFWYNRFTPDRTDNSETISQQFRIIFYDKENKPLFVVRNLYDAEAKFIAAKIRSFLTTK